MDNSRLSLELKKGRKEVKKERKKGRKYMIQFTVNLQTLLFLVGWWHMSDIYAKYSALPPTESTDESQVYNLGSLYLLAV